MLAVSPEQTWAEVATDALCDAAQLAQDVIAVLGRRQLNGEELTVYRDAEKLLTKLETEIDT